MTCRPEEDMCTRVLQNVDSPDEEWAGQWVYNLCGTQETCDDEISHCKTKSLKKSIKLHAVPLTSVTRARLSPSAVFC